MAGQNTHFSDQSNELFRVLREKGFSEDFCKEIAYKRMDTDYTAARMLGYLYRYTEPRIEDVVDEMLAILSDRDMLVRKQEMEQAQVKLNRIYRYGLKGTEEQEGE